MVNMRVAVFALISWCLVAQVFGGAFFSNHGIPPPNSNPDICAETSRSEMCTDKVLAPTIGNDMLSCMASCEQGGVGNYRPPVGSNQGYPRQGPGQYGPRPGSPTTRRIAHRIIRGRMDME